MINDKHTCIIGLGNNEAKFSKTRHNVGFICIDKIISDYESDDCLLVDCIDAKFADIHFVQKTDCKPIYLAKYNKYMNTSGECLKDFNRFNIDKILIICDDLDTETGLIKFGTEISGSNGHNGVKSILENNNKNRIDRIKVGISRPRSLDVSDYVLSNFNNFELSKIEEASSFISSNIYEFCKMKSDKSFLKAISAHNSSIKNLKSD